jgi:hypothetical protein
VFERSAADYLRIVPFLDASERLCRGGRAELFTVMGVPRLRLPQLRRPADPQPEPAVER